MALLSYCNTYRSRRDASHLPSNPAPQCYRVAKLTLLALLAWTLSASDGGSLLGTITDPNGAAIPRANVTATETATAVKQTISTDGRGFYSFQSLPVGRSDVEGKADGF